MLIRTVIKNTVSQNGSFKKGKASLTSSIHYTCNITIVTNPKIYAAISFCGTDKCK